MFLSITIRTAQERMFAWDGPAIVVKRGDKVRIITFSTENDYLFRPVGDYRDCSA